jgi:hypothetical protein
LPRRGCRTQPGVSTLYLFREPNVESKSSSQANESFIQPRPVRHPLGRTRSIETKRLATDASGQAAHSNAEPRASSKKLGPLLTLTLAVSFGRVLLLLQSSSSSSSCSVGVEVVAKGMDEGRRLAGLYFLAPWALGKALKLLRRPLFRKVQTTSEKKSRTIASRQLGDQPLIDWCFLHGRLYRAPAWWYPIGPTSMATRQTSSLKCLPAENRCTSSMTS